MGNVLMTWELGSGFGHVDRLIPIARELAREGHRPILAVSDLVGSAPLLSREKFPVVQSPFWHPRNTPRSERLQVTSYADILAAHGYSAAHLLLPMVEAWQRLIELTQAELIVADHSPTACLAACGATSVVHVGTGFSVPPTDAATFPSLVAGGQSRNSEPQILEAVRQVQRMRGRPLPETLPAALATAGQFVMTFAELDPYRSIRKIPPIGPLHMPAPRARPPEAARFFAYLSSEYPAVDQILESLANAGLAGEVFVRGATPAMKLQLRATGLTVHESPIDLAEVLARISVVIHHAGIGVAELAMCSGCPQLLLPRHLEQKLTADAIAALGIGRSLSGTIRTSEIIQAVRDLSGSTYASLAADFAALVPRQEYPPPMLQIVTLCRSLL